MATQDAIKQQRSRIVSAARRAFLVDPDLFLPPPMYIHLRGHWHELPVAKPAKPAPKPKPVKVVPPRAQFTLGQVKQAVNAIGEKLAHWNMPLPHKRVTRVVVDCDDLPKVLQTSTSGVPCSRGPGFTVFLSDGSQISDPHLAAA